ncbi:CAP domain-containing protein [Patescibacteria group bacterium]|nr:CAP domain-containing protein [Patescibacteria group bacterium]
MPSKNRSIEVTPKASPSYRQEAPGDWGVAKQLSKHTWTIKVGDDTRMATPQEILDALNAYRQRNGKGALAWDDKLATYAQSRAEEFAKMGTTDEHQGFNNFLNNQDGFRQLGFYGLGENSAFGFKLIGVHLIEWIFAADEGHNNNQLNSKWSNVGIGVSGLGVDLIFGGDRM